MDNLTWLIIKNYTRQGILQFYKILGSVDMIGNPIGLIDKLGSGVFEFFNEPRKGLLKGPKEFVGGIGKGVKALVTSVISGSFGSVSKITGSLYGVARSVGGYEEGEERLANPDHVFDGLYQGLKGGVTELAEGVTGIFTKPFKGAKEDGVGGFFKGAGKGVLGLVTSPFTAAFRIGHAVTKGIANTATFLGSGKIKLNGRVRFPRQFGSRKVLEPYIEELAQAQEWLRNI
jgi:vacuolar protein sorting-associated protein 13A/C